MWSWEEETSTTLEGCLLVAGLATTPMHSWEDFAFGRKPSDTIARHPEGTVLIGISKRRVPLVHTKLPVGARGDHAEVTRVFEMLRPFSEISVLEYLRKRKRIKLQW